MKEQLLQDIGQALVDLDMQKTLKNTEELLETDIDPSEIVRKGLSEGMKIVGEKFENGQIYLPQVIISADIFSAAMDLINPRMLESARGKNKVGTVVIGTVQGDIHYIGKDIVANLLKTAGFDVINLGVDVKPSKFISEAERVKADIIAASSLLTTTIGYMKDITAFMNEKNVRNKFFFIIGGAPVTQEWTDEIGADAYGRTARDAINILTNYVSKKGK